MKFKKKLEKTRLKARYKRFLADVVHPEIGELTIHCPNTGSMKNCWQEGWSAWILDSGNPKRKYLYTWILTENDKGEMIGIHSSLANEIVYEAIAEGYVEDLSDFSEIQREVKYGEENSRIDILLTHQCKPNTYIEVKSVTLLENESRGYFPDSISIRGQKHLRELTHCVAQGNRAVLFFLVQHTGIKSVSAAKHIDSDYAALLRQAIDAGVEVLVYDCEINSQGIKLNNRLAFID